MNLLNVLARARGQSVGAVRSDELELAREVLRSQKGDISSAISIVGLCGGEDDAASIESYLSNNLRNIYGELALRSLCRYMGLIDDYRPLIRSNIFSESEMFFNARLSSIQCCDLYFENYSDNELGCRLIYLMMDERDPDRYSAASILVKILNVGDQLNIGFDGRNTGSEELKELAAYASKHFNCSTQ